MRNASWVLLGRGISSVLQAAYAVVLARGLSPEGYGRYRYALAFTLVFMPIANLGLGFVLGKQLGERGGDRRSLLEATWTLRQLTSLFVMVACIVAIWLVGKDRSLCWLMTICALGMYARGIESWCGDVFVGYEQAKLGVRVNIVTRLGELVAGISAVLLGASLHVLGAVYAASWWVAAIIVVYLVRRHVGGFGFRLHWPTLRPVLARAVPLGLVLLALVWLRRGPLTLFGSLGSDAELGQLALLMQILLTAWITAWATSRALLPQLARAADRGLEEDCRLVGLAIRAGFLIGGAGLAVGWAFGAQAVRLVFGAEYAQAGAGVWAVLALSGPLVWLAALQQGLVARGTAWRQLLATLLGAGLLSALVWQWASYGPMGVIAAFTGALLLTVALLLLAYRQQTGLDLARTVLRPALVSGLCLVPLLAYGRAQPELAGTSSLLLALVGGPLLVFNAAERGRIMQLVRSRGRVEALPEDY